MNQIEKFIVYALKKKHPEPVELYCKDIFESILVRAVNQLTKTDFQYSLNMDDIFKETYQQLVENELSIICLVFDNQIYVDQSKLMNVAFFKNFFKDNPSQNLITSLPMNAELSNYKMMKKVIHFLNHGFIRGEYKLDFTILYQLALINDYLLEVSWLPQTAKDPLSAVISEDNIQYNSLGNKHKPTTLKKYLANLVNDRLSFFTDDFKNYHSDTFNMIYHLYFLLKLNAIILSKNIILKYKEDFLKSNLFTKSTFEYQTRIIEDMSDMNPFPLKFVY